MMLMMLGPTDGPAADPPPMAIMTTAEAMALPQPEADHVVAYGPDPLHFGELRLPAGPGPHPVAVVVHGGCWLADYGLGYMSGFAAALTEAGIATWSLEYRRVGDDGGGWPGTFRDVGRGADHLRSLADEFDLDLARIVAVGHSAGGQLALWLAARAGLDTDDELRGADPLPIAGVVSVAGIADLAAYAAPEGCGAAVAPLLGGDPADVPERTSRVSPVARVPLGVPQHLIVGAADPIVPPDHVRRYAAVAEQAGDRVEVVVIPSAGHVATVTPHREPFTVVLRAVRSVLGMPEPDGRQKERPRGEGSPGRE